MAAELVLGQLPEPVPKAPLLSLLREPQQPAWLSVGAVLPAFTNALSGTHAFLKRLRDSEANGLQLSFRVWPVTAEQALSSALSFLNNVS